MLAFATTPLTAPVAPPASSSSKALIVYTFTFRFKSFIVTRFAGVAVNQAEACIIAPVTSAITPGTKALRARRQERGASHVAYCHVAWLFNAHQDTSQIRNG